jgi:hypothetical protein
MAEAWCWLPSSNPDLQYATELLLRSSNTPSWRGASLNTQTTVFFFHSLQKCKYITSKHKLFAKLFVWLEQVISEFVGYHKFLFPIWDWTTENMVAFVFSINEWWRNKLLIFSVFGRLLPWRYGLCHWWFGGKFCLHLQGIIEKEKAAFIIYEDGLSWPKNLNVQWYFTPVDIFGTIHSVMSKHRR